MICYFVLLFVRLGRLLATPVQLRHSLMDHFITRNNSNLLLLLLCGLLLLLNVLLSYELLLCVDVCEAREVAWNTCVA